MWLRTLFVFLVGLTASPSFAQSTTPQTSAEFQRWIRQLSSDDYFLREQATSQLLSAGEQAKAVLEAALVSPEMETRTRSKRILELIELREKQRQREEFEQKLDLFVQHPEQFAASTFPAWEEFAETFGSDQPQREFYTQMAKVNYPLLVKVEANRKEAAGLLKQQLKHLQTVVQPNIQARTGRFSLDPYWVSSMLFSSLVIKKDIHAEYDVLLNWAFYQDELRDFRTQSVFRQILITWLETPELSLSDWNRVRLLMEYELKEGLPSVVRMLEKSQKSSSVNSHALVFVGKFGGKEHLPLIESFLEAERVCHIHIRNNERFYVQTRDLALAILITLTDQSHHDYHFKRIEYDDKQLFRIWTLGFRKDQDDLRKQALLKWKQWSKEHRSVQAAKP